MSPRKYTIKNLRDHALKRGGSCLSAEYKGPLDRYRWKCAAGHTWPATWANVMIGTWCRQCSGRAPGSIECMHELASGHGGRCLSATYVNAQTHLEWECAKRHRWPAKPNNIQQGKWCSICRQAQARQKQLRPISTLQEYALSKGGRLLSTSYTFSRQKLQLEC